jgi:hypothetical protein
MNKYKCEDYFSVIDKRTRKKIVDCADQIDALMMVSFDSENRLIVTNKFAMGQVVDVEIPKALPTTDVIAVHTVSSDKFDDYVDNLFEPKRAKLPEGQGKPVII